MLVLVILLAFQRVLNAQVIPDELTSHRNWRLLDRGIDCGFSLSDRIIGGERASLGQYPWMARMGYSVDLEPEELVVDAYECGGTIISDRYVLTAAHCSTKALEMKMLQVRVGEFDTKTLRDCNGNFCAPEVQDIDIEAEICHQGYSAEFHNDICIIRLMRPIQFNDFVKPICLPVYDNLMSNGFEGSIMEVAGWGVMDILTKETSSVLMTLKVPILSNFLCSITYSGWAEITGNQMCAGGVVGKDSCSGDSGGPLMKPFAINGPPRYFIIGIVSFGPKKCADSETPGVYTRVSKYLKWILDTIHE